MKVVKYSYGYQVVRKSGSVESQCAGISFVNIGTDIVTVLGYPLQPGFGYEPPNQFAGGWDETNYEVNFAGGAGLTQVLLVIKQTYSDAIS